MKMKTASIVLAAGIFLAALLNSFGQPVITTEPQSSTNVVGTDASFTVLATGTGPLAYQWRLSTAAVAGMTNDTLIVTNVQVANAGGYTVVVTNIDGAVTSLVAVLTVLVPPSITKQPTNQSVSLGANATFSALAAGTSPLHYQWRFGETNLPGKISTSLIVTNVQLTNAGDYTVVVTNLGGAVTSHVAHLEVDTTFSKITIGQIVNDGGFGFGCAWGDYDNDGFIDLFVANDAGSGFNGNDFLYHNNGDGTFARITTGTIVNDGVWSISGSWADYDNDGYLDLFVGMPDLPNRLFHNNGNGTFTRITSGLIVTQPMHSHASAWGDVDNDGLLDLFVVNFNDGTGARPLDNYLYRNIGGGAFDRVSFGTKSLTNGDSWNVAAADFNNDGWIDLFVPQGGTATPQKSQNSLLYTNNQNGAFILLTNSIAFTNQANGVACAWGDYDNDGFLDLFVSNFYGQNNFLYHNNRDGTFTAITNSPVTLDGGTSVGCAWGDYDNDGWLDLFVANLGPVDPNTLTSIAPENNFLYHNNRDGTFTKVTAGSLVNDGGYSTGCAWADYDNDGFLDLFVSNGWVTKSENNFLYRNNGNSNNWITFKLVGTLSNRSAIGAKVRVKAIIDRNTVWQMREISGGSNYGSQNDMRPNFGLGDATNIDLVRIEWPSGIVQTLTNVAAKQFLRVEEHQLPGGVIATPSFTSVSRSANGAVDLTVTGDAGLLYLFETSTNLVNWSWLGVRSNATGTIQFTDPRATNFTKRFYRVSAP